MFLRYLKTKEQTYIVAHRSRPEHTKGAGYIRLNGNQYALDLIELHTKKIDLYQAADMQVEISSWKPVVPFCKGTEYEGAHFNVNMKIKNAADSIHLKALAHCGA